MPKPRKPILFNRQLYQLHQAYGKHALVAPAYDRPRNSQLRGGHGLAQCTCGYWAFVSKNPIKHYCEFYGSSPAADLLASFPEVYDSLKTYWIEVAIPVYSSVPWSKVVEMAKNLKRAGDKPS